jgi:hypothetical protein
MDYDILHNWTVLRALMIFAIAAAFLVFAGIVVCYKAWRESDRRRDARTGDSSTSKHRAGNITAPVA